MLRIEFDSLPPSKSNSYRIGNSPSRAFIYTTKEVKLFENELARVAIEAMGYTPTWAIPPDRIGKSKNPKPRPIDPFFARMIEVDISVTVYAKKNRHDTDNMAKAIGDALTIAGVWYDDKQVRDWHLYSRKGTADRIEIELVPVIEGLKLPSPLGRREWAEQKVAEASLNLPPPMPTTFCDKCDVAIGPHCLEEEAWVWPIIRHGRLVCKVICGSCADKLELDFKYRAITAERIKQIRRYQIGIILHTCMEELRSEYSKSKSRRRSVTESGVSGTKRRRDKDKLECPGTGTDS